MTENKRTVERYIDGFNRLDHDEILDCLTEDVEWEMPGFFCHIGIAAFDREIENDDFVGKPVISLLRLIEEGNIVVAEGSVRAKRKDGGHLNAVFCDVFAMKGGKIRRLTTYLMEVKEVIEPWNRPSG